MYKRQALFVLGTALGGHLGSVNPLGILVLLYLAFICGAGSVLWALLMKNNPVSRIAIFGFVNLVVNVLLSAVLNGEPLFRWQYLAALDVYKRQAYTWKPGTLPPSWAPTARANPPCSTPSPAASSDVYKRQEPAQRIFSEPGQ